MTAIMAYRLLSHIVEGVNFVDPLFIFLAVLMLVVWVSAAIGIACLIWVWRFLKSIEKEFVDD